MSELKRTTKQSFILNGDSVAEVVMVVNKWYVEWPPKSHMIACTQKMLNVIIQIDQYVVHMRFSLSNAYTISH